MKTPALNRPPASLARRVAVPSAALAIAVVVFLAGRWTASEEPATAAERQASPRPAAAAPAPAADPAFPPPSGPPERAVPRPAERLAATPQVVGLAAEEARAQLESVRPQLVSQCWPAGGLGRGREKARLTFHLTFDAAGREVARGISEDRGAPAGSFARCLRTLPIGALSIPAPGARVGVRVALNFP
jgi:hypothetical protein